VVQDIELEEAEEQTSDADLEVDSDAGVEESEAAEPKRVAELRPHEIRDYVKSLQSSSAHWFNTFYPDLSDDFTAEEVQWIQRLNRLGMAYFRPLLMAILKKFKDPVERVDAFKAIERFIFVLFRLTQARSNYRSSEFSNAVRAIDRGEMDLATLKQRLHNQMGFTFTEKGEFNIDDFRLLMQKKFDGGQGLLRLVWAALFPLRVRIEPAVFQPAEETRLDGPAQDPEGTHLHRACVSTDRDEGMGARVQGRPQEGSGAYRNSLGNLLLLSSAINSSLQNDAFVEKKKPKLAADGNKLRNGYADGSHSEIEVSRNEDWGPDQIRERGKRLLKFLEKRWQIQFPDDAAKEALLFIGAADDAKVVEGDAG
jgi:hypothetical protein